MPNLYASLDGRISTGIGTSWSNARDDTSGTVYSTEIRSGSFIEVARFASRGGGNTYRITRSFMYFDTSGITGTVSAATIKIRGYPDNDGSIVALKSTAYGGDGGTALASGDFDAIPGWTTGASAESSVTKYSGTITSGSWNTSGYNDLTGNSDLRADMQNNDAVIICFIDYTNDLLNVALTSNGQANLGAFYTDYYGTSLDPYIEYTIATGYGNAVNGVAATNISKINGVATASISKVNGI